MINMPQRDIRLLMLKLGHNASETFANINRPLMMMKVEDEHAVLRTNNCQHLLSKFLVSVSEKCPWHLASVLQQFHVIYRALET